MGPERSQFMRDRQKIEGEKAVRKGRYRPQESIVMDIKRRNA